MKKDNNKNVDASNDENQSVVLPVYQDGDECPCDDCGMGDDYCPCSDWERWSESQA